MAKLKGFPGVPAAMTVANGMIYVTTKVNAETFADAPHPALWVTDDLWGENPAWINVAKDSNVYNGMGHIPNSISVDANGDIYISMQNQGVLVGRVIDEN